MKNEWSQTDVTCPAHFTSYSIKSRQKKRIPNPHDLLLMTHSNFSFSLVHSKTVFVLLFFPNMPSANNNPLIPDRFTTRLIVQYYGSSYVVTVRIPNLVTSFSFYQKSKCSNARKAILFLKTSNILDNNNNNNQQQQQQQQHNRQYNYYNHQRQQQQQQ